MTDFAQSLDAALVCFEPIFSLKSISEEKQSKNGTEPKTGQKYVESMMYV